jgi:predicted ester cyclase
MATETSVQEENRKTVLRGYEDVWNEGASDVAREIVHPDFHDHPPTRFFDLGGSGPESLIATSAHFREAFPDFRDRVVVMVAEDDYVAYLGEISGTQEGQLFGFPPTGNRMRVLGITFLRLEEGKIIDRWGLFDMLSIMQQLGLAPSPTGQAPPPRPEEPASQSGPPTSSIEENKAVYTRFVEEVINGGNIDIVEELYTPDYHDHTAPPGAPPGLDAVRMIPKMFRGAFPDVRFTIEKLVGEGDLVASRVTGHGTQTGQFLAFPPSGKEATWTSLGFFRVRDGKIVEHWGAPDLLGLLIQIGVIPPPAGGAREVEQS